MIRNNTKYYPFMPPKNGFQLLKHKRKLIFFHCGAAVDKEGRKKKATNERNEQMKEKPKNAKGGSKKSNKRAKRNE